MKRACFVFYALSQGTLGAHNIEEGLQGLQDPNAQWDDHNTALYYLNEVFQGAEGYSSPALERLKTCIEQNLPGSDLCKDILLNLSSMHRMVNTNNPVLIAWPGLKDEQLETNKYSNTEFDAITKMKKRHQLREIRNRIRDRCEIIRTILDDGKTEMEQRANEQHGEANHLDLLELPFPARSRSSSNVSEPGSIGSSLSARSVASVRDEEKTIEADVGDQDGPGWDAWDHRAESPSVASVSDNDIEMKMSELDDSDEADVGNCESTNESGSFDGLGVDWSRNVDYVDITHESDNAQKGSDSLQSLPQSDQVKILRGKAAGNRAQHKPGFSLPGKAWDYDAKPFNPNDF